MGTRTAKQIRRDKVFNVPSKGSRRKERPTRNLSQAVDSDQAKRIVQGLLSCDLSRDIDSAHSMQRETQVKL